MELVNLKALVNVILFSVMGIVALSVSFLVFDKLTPGNLWKEMVEEQNVALGIMVGAMVLGMAQIIAAAVHG